MHTLPPAPDGAFVPADCDNYDIDLSAEELGVAATTDARTATEDGKNPGLRYVVTTVHV